MSGFYKMEPVVWDRNTDNLTLEQEAAYLRICNAIYAADQPILANTRMLAGMWRCNERKAKRLLAELIAAEKVSLDGPWIVNERAVDDVSTRRALRVQRQLAGTLGGIESGKSRAKSAKSKDKGEANASTRKEEEIEEEKKRSGASHRKASSPSNSTEPGGYVWERSLSFGENQTRAWVVEWAKTRTRPRGLLDGLASGHLRALVDRGFITELERAWLLTQLSPSEASA